MSRPDDLDDEYVAQMLKKDAEANSIKHLALGSKLSYQTGKSKRMPSDINSTNQPSNRSHLCAKAEYSFPKKHFTRNH